MNNNENTVISFVASQLLFESAGTGGDIVFCKVAANAVDYSNEVNIIAPIYFKEKFASKKIKIRHLSLGKLDSLFYSCRYPILVPLVYFYRIFTTLKSLNNIKSKIIFTSGDFICNTGAVFLHKIFGRKRTIWVAYVFHIIPNLNFRKVGNLFGNIFSLVSQKLSLILIKNKADYVLYQNENVREVLLSCGISSQRLIYVPNGIELDEINRIKNNKHDKCISACYLGRLNATKGIIDLIRAWKIVIGEFHDAKLVIIGHGYGDYYKLIKSTIEELGFERNIEITGFIDRDIVYENLASAKMFVSASYEEGWGISIMEALAFDLPVIAYDLKVYREIFKECINTVNIGDYKELAEKIVDIMQHYDIYKEQVMAKKFDLCKYDWKIITKNLFKKVVVK